MKVLSVRFLRITATLIGVILSSAAPAHASTTAVTAGQPVTLTATADGTAPFTYQWYKNGVVLTGSTNSTYVISNFQAADAGTYSAIISNSAGSDTTDDAVLTLAIATVAPVFTTHPASQTVVAGGAVTFTTVATGTPSPTFQWQKDGANIIGATSTSYTISNSTAGSAGNYTVIATNSAGVATSNGAVLTVNSPPSFTSQPVSQTITAGGSVSFTAAASGSPSPSFQWQKNGVNIIGATSASYTLSIATLSDAGSYTVIATNAVNAVTSNPATLTVNPAPSAPVFTTQPLGQTVIAGSAITFTTGASGNPSPTFQWQKNGVNIIGATSTSYTLSSVALSDAGSYTATATNAVSAVTSNPATLTVNPAPFAPFFTVQPSGQTVTAGSSVTFSAAANGLPSPAFQWQKNGVNLIGATGASYTIPSVATGDAGSYAVVATNSVSAVTSNPATLTVNPASSAPVFTIQPVSQTVTAGASVTFTAAANGTPSPTYQWSEGGIAIAGATSASYTIASVVVGDAGAYTVVATNSVSAVSSNPATLTVNPAPSAPVFTTQPASQTVTAGGSVTFTAAANGTPSPSFQWQKNGVNIIGATSTSYAIANTTTAHAGTYTVIATNSSGSAISNPATLTVNPAPSAPVFTTQPASQTVTAGASVTLTATANGTPSPSYQWKKGGATISGATNASYTITSVVAGDAGSYTVVATNSVNAVTSNTAVLTVNAATAAPTITTQPISQTVTAGTAVTFTVAASGVPAPTYQWKKDGVVISGATGTSHTISNTVTASAGTYTVVVTNSAGSVASSGAVLTINTFPAITTQPISQTVTAGSSISFTAAASGAPTPTFQWKKAGAAISGATASTYTISNVTSGNAGSYTVTVTNSVGTATSSAAILTVNPTPAAPVFTIQPTNQAVIIRGSVTFIAAATGTPTPTFQWKKDGVAIPGATSATYTIAATTPSDEASYTVVATNTVSAVTSNAAALSVLVAPKNIVVTLTIQ